MRVLAACGSALAVAGGSGSAATERQAAGAAIVGTGLIGAAVWRRCRSAGKIGVADDAARSCAAAGGAICAPPKLAIRPESAIA